MSRSVTDITTAIASGDPEAFSIFYRQWFDYAFAEARLASHGDEQFCLDIVQEAMMRVIRHLQPMQSEDDLRRWFRTVVQSACYDEFRRRTRRRKREHSHDKARSFASSGDDQDRLAWLRDQLRQIAPDQLHLLSMRFRLDRTLQQIGMSLGIGPGAADGRLNRIIASLRRQANEDFHE